MKSILADAVQLRIMDSIIGFIINCFMIGAENKAQRRASYGCMFAIVGVFALAMLVGLAFVWKLLRP